MGLLRGRRRRLNDDERRRLAVRGVALDRQLIDPFASIVTPETILRWHRQLIAAKWTFPSPRRSRREVMQKIADLVVRMARDNPSWGYDRIQGALTNLGHRVAQNTVKAILRKHGIDPAPERRLKTTWRQFLRTHLDSIAAADFLTTEVWTARGLVTWYTYFVIHLATRTVEVVGSAPHPGDEFMKQIARNLTDAVDGFLTGKRFLILDRDSKFSDGFNSIVEAAGIEIIRCPPRAPNRNAHAERFVRSIKSECLDRLLFVGGGALRHALTEYCAHFNAERNHQGIGNRLIEPDPVVASEVGSVVHHRRLGGLLSFCHRRAA